MPTTRLSERQSEGEIVKVDYVGERVEGERKEKKLLPTKKKSASSSSIQGEVDKRPVVKRGKGENKGKFAKMKKKQATNETEGDEVSEGKEAKRPPTKKQRLSAVGVSRIHDDNQQLEELLRKREREMDEPKPDMYMEYIQSGRQELTPSFLSALPPDVSDHCFEIIKATSIGDEYFRLAEISPDAWKYMSPKIHKRIRLSASRISALIDPSKYFPQPSQLPTELQESNLARIITLFENAGTVIFEDITSICALDNFLKHDARLSTTISQIPNLSLDGEVLYEMGRMLYDKQHPRYQQALQASICLKIKFRPRNVCLNVQDCSLDGTGSTYETIIEGRTSKFLVEVFEFWRPKQVTYHSVKSGIILPFESPISRIFYTTDKNAWRLTRGRVSWDILYPRRTSGSEIKKFRVDYLNIMTDINAVDRTGMLGFTKIPLNQPYTEIYNETKEENFRFFTHNNGNPCICCGQR